MANHTGRGSLSHGHARRDRQTPEYKTWARMRARCARHPHYVSHGITVCPRWSNFANFLADMGPKPTSAHTLDRIRNAEGYGPDNCRWATWAEQFANTTQVKPLEINGERLLISQWAKRAGIRPSTIYHRLAAGMSPAVAVFTPMRDMRPIRCKRGHVITGVTTWAGREVRYCQTCKRTYNKTRYHRMKAEQVAHALKVQGGPSQASAITNWDRRAASCRRTLTRHMRHGSADATKFWTIELVRALRWVYNREIC